MIEAGSLVMILEGEHKGRVARFIDDYPMTHVVGDPDVPHVRVKLLVRGKPRELILPQGHIRYVGGPLSKEEVAKRAPTKWGWGDED